jgi:glycerophosphoryl diester phosphodiesterase
LSSFNHSYLRQISAHRPEFEIQAIVGLSAFKPLDWGDLDFTTYNARHTLIRSSKIRQLAEKGISVNVWSVNRESDMRRFIEAGAVGIITDFPQVLANLKIS